MSYDDTVDPLVTAVLAVVKARVNAAMAAELGDVASFPAIDATHGYPVVLDLLAQTKLPAFACFRENEAPYTRGRRVDTRTRLKLIYVGPDTPVHRLDQRWPLLYRVWAETLAALQDGTDPDTGENVFEEACVVEVEDTSWSVDYDFAVGDQGFAYPAWVATVFVQWRPTRVSNAVFFKELITRLDLTGPSASDEYEGIVRQHLVRGGYDRGFDLGFGDRDDG